MKAPSSDRVLDLRRWNGDGWSPWQHPRTVLVFNPFEYVRTVAGQLSVEPVSWRTAAQDSGWSESQWERFWPTAYPNPAALTAAARERSPDHVNGPTEGLLEVAARRAVAPVLTAALASASGAVGLYRGFEDRNALVEGFPQVSVSALPYAVLEADVAQVLAEWAADQPSDSWWTTLMSFLWPDDRSWFLRIDPDAAFAAIGCTASVADQLLADPRLECREA